MLVPSSSSSEIGSPSEIVRSTSFHFEDRPRHRYWFVDRLVRDRKPGERDLIPNVSEASSGRFEIGKRSQKHEERTREQIAIASHQRIPNPSE